MVVVVVEGGGGGGRGRECCDGEDDYSGFDRRRPMLSHIISLDTKLATD